MSGRFSCGPKFVSKLVDLDRQLSHITTMKRLSALSLIILLLAAGCGNQPVTELPSFDADRAFSYIEKQVSFGPRVPGSAASAACREFMKNHLESTGAVIDSQAFDFFDPYSQTNIRMVNLVGSFGTLSKENKAVALVAHYDSRPRTDFASDPALLNEPIDGANDGGSGVAVLLEMANMFKEVAPPVPIDIIMVDGEDWGKPGDTHLYLLGSQQYVRLPVRDKYRFVLVVDMVADQDQRFYRDSLSEMHTKWLNDLVFNTAHSLGLDMFVDSLRNTILDDHIPFLASGVPAITIIDMDYPYWHTEFDTPDKCSPQSLDNIGLLLREIIYKKVP